MDVARAIAGELRLTLTQEAEARLASGRQFSDKAYEAYIKGRVLERQWASINGRFSGFCVGERWWAL